MPHWGMLILAVLAVPGLYYLFCVILTSFFQGKRYTLLIEGDDLSLADLLTEVQAASLYAEGKRLVNPRPMVLFRVPPSEDRMQLLAEYGVAVCFSGAKSGGK